jgi:hypothetical protein
VPHAQTLSQIQRLLDDGKRADALRFTDFLHKVLEEGAADERKEAARLLCYVPEVGDRESIARLLGALEREERMEVVKNIVWALRGLEARTAIPKLQAMARDSRYGTLKEWIEKAIRYLSGN